MNKKPILEIENLKKYFVNKSVVNKAVDGVSFKVHEGEVVGLIGESGSGKTTVGRSLLRLYDDFNGFVTLDGDIISGKRISRSRSKKMRKNIQMIFQDPHASLNGQKTIFSILKEPLIVNKIIKDELDELKKDWKYIQENFHYTFLEFDKKNHLEDIKKSNKLLNKFVSKWEGSMEEIDFNLPGNIDDKFNEFYSYLEEKVAMHSSIIGEYYTTNEDMLKLYKSRQEEYRSQNLSYDEVELKNARDSYEQGKKLARYSSSYIDLSEQKAALVASLKAQKRAKRDALSISKNVISNICEEMKHEMALHKNNALSTVNLAYHLHSFKMWKMNESAYKQVKSLKSKLQYLDLQQTKRMVKEVNEYISNFYKNLDGLNAELESSKDDVLKAVNEHFLIDLSSYIELSNNKEMEVNNQIRELETQIKSLKEKLKVAKKDPAAISHDQLEKRKVKLEKAQNLYDSELAVYVQEYQKRIYDLDILIAKALDEDAQLTKRVHSLDVVFKQTFSRFRNWYLNDYLKSLGDDKKKISLAKIDLNIYKTNVKKKNESLASYFVEKKYLRKDLSSIRKILGTDLVTDKLFAVNKKARKVALSVLGWLYTPQIKYLFIKNRIYQALNDVGLLKQFAYRYPHEFSGGQRQRIVIARALITNPKVIVADEPIASLDISIQAQVVNLLKDLCEKKKIGMIFIAHDLSMIEYVADRVQIMHLGKIVESGKTEKIYDKPIHPYTNNLFKAIPKISNANEKFQNVSFELSYLEEQRFPNVPFIHEIEKDHFVYGTDSQVEKWLKSEHYSKASTRVK
ncbi:ATP-binding cassette domain-containing protein [Mycoplasma sp. Ms02]|uniref:ATP-binding cassette domain-containing protein n=1 Tax=Mycoplasma sp. Ms02 TaxID=353851 RepID=UPI001C88E63D|nr:ATP-binding cassette domain-containing protein [Mycoplasma sp. Ms02]QZE12641.1 ATP-binding cassette domain-containing protein [Mycoplasma sp. Ms02]